MARVTCPRCAVTYEVFWDHPYFPAHGKRLAFMCPEHGEAVVLSDAIVWAELPAGMRCSEDDCFVEPFHQ